MRLRIAWISRAVMALTLFCVASESLDDSPLLFAASFREIETWLKNRYSSYSSSNLRLDRLDVNIILADSASGAAATEILVYRKSSAIWELLLYRSPHYGTITIKKEAGQLVFEGKDGRAILIVPFTGLLDVPRGMKQQIQPVPQEPAASPPK